MIAKYVVGPVDNDLLNSMGRTCNDIGGVSWRDDIIFATVHQQPGHGDVTLRALDRDPKEGLIFVARWDFDISP